MAISVGPRARESLRGLDPWLQLELIERVATLAEAPAEYLARASVHEFPGAYVYRFHSTAVDGLLFTLLFAGFDDDPKRLVLFGIGTTMDADDEERE